MDSKEIEEYMKSSRAEKEMIDIALTSSLVEKPVKEVLREFLLRTRHHIKSHKQKMMNLNDLTANHGGIKKEKINIYLGHSENIEDFVTDVPQEFVQPLSEVIRRFGFFFMMLQTHNPCLKDVEPTSDEQKMVMWFEENGEKSNYLGFIRKDL